MHAPPLVLAAAFGGLHLAEFVPPLLASCAYLYLYAVRARTLSRERRPVDPWRTAAFVAGVVLLTRCSCRRWMASRTRCWWLT